jgi:hypothetical protein
MKKLEINTVHPHGDNTAAARHGKTTARRGFDTKDVEVVEPVAIRLYMFQANTGARRFHERRGYAAVQFTRTDNEERCPDVLYELR